eukprot:scaffold36239_cov78-Attheya_sp.AAC.4
MADNVVQVCHACGGDTFPALACGRYHMAWYCSHHCQKKNWVRGSHRQECPMMAWFLFERMAREEHGQAAVNPENLGSLQGGGTQVDVLQGLTVQRRCKKHELLVTTVWSVFTRQAMLWDCHGAAVTTQCVVLNTNN